MSFTSNLTHSCVTRLIAIDVTHSCVTRLIAMHHDSLRLTCLIHANANESQMSQMPTSRRRRKCEQVTNVANAKRSPMSQLVTNVAICDCRNLWLVKQVSFWHDLFEQVRTSQLRHLWPQMYIRIHKFICTFRRRKCEQVTNVANANKSCQTYRWVMWHTQVASKQHTATFYNTLQHTATHYNTLQHTATHCNTLQHTATHCNSLQHTATHCSTLQRDAAHPWCVASHRCAASRRSATICNILQHTATHCNSLQHTTTRCNTLQHDATRLWCVASQHSATLCNISQHTATHCNSLQHTATHCNMLQHTATRCIAMQRNYDVLHACRDASYRCCIVTACWNMLLCVAVSGSVLQPQMRQGTHIRVATHRRCVASRCSVLQCVAVCCRECCSHRWGKAHIYDLSIVTIWLNSAHCNTLQHAATRCNTLQHAATRCNTLHLIIVTIWCCASCHIRRWDVLDMSCIQMGHDRHAEESCLRHEIPSS